MNKIKIKGIKFKLEGESIQTGQVLNFRAKNKDNTNFNLSDIKGIKVLSVFPALNTRVCDMQTLQIKSFAAQYKNVSFISVTNDSLDVINEWCAAHDAQNIDVVSDLEYGEFARATNLKIHTLNKLARGFMILDEENKIIAQAFKEELSDEPDYELVKQYLK